ncbi:DUF5684 domain-containing protein, partial [Bacteroidales bacterium OttesenSCG-928-K03]|nr:DUF5684 domain-containing protein [Bacteroidales bacterium OttesenSCG-928-K03]
MDSVILTFLIIKWFFPIFAFKIFEEAGYKWWYSFIPGFNYYIWMKLTKRPFWWFAILIIPFIGFFIMLLLQVSTAKSYGKFKLWQEALAVFFPFAYFPYLGFSKDEHYYAVRPEYK